MGSSKKQTVGYRYRMGLHMGICLEPDALLELTAGDRRFFLGEVADTQTVGISSPKLFGGDEREGGIQGTLDVMMGRPDQGPNAYLTSMQGGFQPGYRGFLGLVYRGLITSNNPYIKNWSARVRSILKGWDGDVVWYPERAIVPVGSSSFQSATSLYLALDISSSMSGTKLATMKEAVGIVLDQLAAQVSAGAPPINIRIVAWSSAATYQQAMPLNGSNVDDLRAFVNGLSATGGTSATAAYGGMQAFMTESGYSNRVVVCVSDGAMSDIAAAQAQIAAAEAALGTINMRGVGIETVGSLANFDNSGGSVPVVTGTNTDELAAVVLAALSTSSAYKGMNPVHVIYQALTDPDWGMGYPRELIDDANFRAAADKCYSEGFGLCLKWVNQSSVRAFTQTIADHVALNYGQSRQTGKFEIQMLRQDYVEADLPVFTKKNVRVVSYQRPALTDTVNEIIIEYTDIVSGKDASTAPLQNLANIMAQGRIVSQKLSFPGLPSNSLAVRAGMRELQSRSTPLWKMKLEFQRGAATHLKSGKPFIVDLLDTPLGARVIMRAVELNLGTTVDAVITGDCVEDVFGMPSAAYVGEPTTPPDPPDTSPQPAIGMVFEVPYRELIQALGATETAALPVDAAYVGAVALRPAGVPMNYSLITRIGTAEYVDAGVGDFAPAAVAADIIPRQIGPTTFAYSSGSSLSNIAVGDAAWLGEGADAELVRIDAIDTTASTITIGRGCGDTIPAEWPAATRLWVFDDFNTYDPEQYVAGEVVNAKILTNATGGQQDAGTAPELALAMTGRAGRPYPPAAPLVNGLYFPTDPVDTITLSWTHRDRVTQADLLVDASMGNMGPEAGVTYSLTIENESAVIVYSADGITANSFIVPAEGIPYDSDIAVVRLWAERDGLRSLQEYVIPLTMPTSEGGDLEFEIDETLTPADGGNLQFVLGAP